MCTVLLPRGANPIAVNKPIIISYHIISYFETPKTVQPWTERNIPEDVSRHRSEKFFSECPKKYIVCVSTIERSGDKDNVTVLPDKMNVHK